MKFVAEWKAYEDAV